MCCARQCVLVLSLHITHSAQWRAAPDCRAPPSPIVTHNSLCDVVGGGQLGEGGTMRYLIFTLYYALFNYSDCAGTKLWMDLSSALCQNLITRPSSRHVEDVLWNTIFGDRCCCFKNLHISKRSLLKRWLNKLPQSQNWNSFSPNLHIAQWSNAFSKRVQ